MNHGVEMIGPDNIKRAANTIVEDDYVRSAFSFFGREGEVVTIEEKIYMDDQHHIIRIERKRRL
ncbi:hypothetical protein SARC_15149 [Sphaeroforma arctica JP610]|uniref:Uncharacterized protein n=1 Tax=Sphaeroforma arctica JP610 TaxID=667725 RepID=A0A0L0F6E6_9EUKA|nr:hypothetical protein SARC_15149 [Sphaeroforma arctica JP610]KNC72295.1 hypothetical protein SARC_15149 [Sphaeroforma arctica JP610]|eukprot:XP_014146197.1 hypothetical protein SARC_15149 [Sphaeroforma arctica JP610]